MKEEEEKMQMLANFNQREYKLYNQIAVDKKMEFQILWPE